MKNTIIYAPDMLSRIMFDGFEYSFGNWRDWFMTESAQEIFIQDNPESDKIVIRVSDENHMASCEEVLKTHSILLYKGSVSRYHRKVMIKQFRLNEYTPKFYIYCKRENFNGGVWTMEHFSFLHSMIIDISLMFKER